MRKFGPLQNSNRIPNHQALALVMLLLGADKNAVHNQKIIEAAKTIWPKIGHKTSSDRIDKLINQMIYINSDLFETKNGKYDNKATGHKRKLTRTGTVYARQAIDVVNPRILQEYV